MSVVLRYAVGSIGTGLYSTIPAILLLFFMTQQLEIPLGLATLAVLLPKVAIIVVDPLIGAWSDRRIGPGGRRRPFLLAGAFLCATAFTLLFSAPRLDSDLATFAVVTALYFAANLAYSLFAVPYVAMLAEMSSDPVERARIIAWRMAFVFGGVLLGGGAAPVLVDLFGGGPPGYRWMGLGIGVAALTSMLSAASSARHLPSPVSIPERAWLRDLLSVGQQPSYRLAAATYLLAMVATGTYTAAAPYFITIGLGLPDHSVGTFFAIQIGASIPATLVWARIVPRFEQPAALVTALVLQAIGCVILNQAGTDHLDGLAMMGVCITGIGAAGVQVASFALLATVVRDDARRSRRQREGLLTGVWTAAEKCGLALGPALCGAVLAAGGFVAGLPATELPATAVAATRIALTVAPAITLSIVALWLLLYRRTLTRR